ncbi:MAG: dihydroneopterin aldolase [Pseudomonadota bacterium]
MNEIHDAFAHPEARARATGERVLPDRISLRDHVVEAEIGAFQAERGRKQRLNFNIVVEVTAPGEPLDDDVDRILSYDKVTEAIALELQDERLNLLETLAERIAARVLLEPRALRIFVQVEKLDRGPGALGVEIVRRRAARATLPDDDADVPHPRVVLVSNAVLASADLTARVDDWAASDAPLILCVGLPDALPLQVGTKMVQRRIDLLAIEQNAWRLADRDRRCVVVNTRTELDWAMRQGQISVWAPSKMVLDAMDGPTAAPSEAAALALWFAETLEARELLCVGVAPPHTQATSPVPVRRG